MRGRLLKVVFVAAAAGMLSSFLLGCVVIDWLSGDLDRQRQYAADGGYTESRMAAVEKAADEKNQKALDAEQNDAASTGLEPDMTSIVGPHMLTFAGANPAPNNFQLMNSTGFLSAEGGKWTAQKTVKFVPAGGSSGFDRYMFDVTKASDGTLSGTVRFTRKMVLVYPDTKKDAKTLVSAWKGTVTGKLEADGSISGKVTGSRTNSSTYFNENRPKGTSPLPPENQPPDPITWTFTGQW